MRWVSFERTRSPFLQSLKQANGVPRIPTTAKFDGNIDSIGKPVEAILFFPAKPVPRCTPSSLVQRLTFTA
jgi:hypothetical protein